MDRRRRRRCRCVYGNYTNGWKQIRFVDRVYPINQIAQQFEEIQAKERRKNTNIILTNKKLMLRYDSYRKKL